MLTYSLDLIGPIHAHSIVEYSTPEEAQKAISELTNKQLDGRQVFVREVCCLPSWKI